MKFHFLSIVIIFLICPLFYLKKIEEKYAACSCNETTYLNEGTDYINRDTTTFINNYASIYFNNLHYNIGYNVKGSCGHVAIGMYLSYLDSYLDDDIIPENYDFVTMLENNIPNENTESPGIYSEDYPVAYMSITNTQYLTNIYQYYPYYFHLNLIKMALDNNISNYDSESINPAAITNSQAKALVHYYLRNYRGYSSSDYTLNSTVLNVRNFVINKVSNGIPVVTMISSSTLNKAHFVVIYDYDTNNDELYANFGWKDGSTVNSHVALSTTDYDLCGAAFTIEMNCSHSCSDNYVHLIGTNQTIEYCSCFYSIHESHSHEKYCDYVWDNLIRHSRICKCDQYSVYLPHIVDSNTIQPGQMYSNCMLCGGLALHGFIGNNFGDNNVIIAPSGVVIIDGSKISEYLFDSDSNFKIENSNYEKQLYIYWENRG